MKEKNIFEKLSCLNAKTNIKKYKLLLNMIKCYFKHGINFDEYDIFSVYNLSDDKIKQLFTNKLNKKYIRKYNKIDSSTYKYRSLFYKKFNRFKLDQWLELTGNNIADFADFIKDKETFIANYDNISNKYEEEVKVDLKNYTLTYNDLVLTKKVIAKEILKEAKDTHILNKYQQNYISFIVIDNEIICSYLVTSKDDNKENYMYAPINVETGIIDYPAVDNNLNTYEIHPASGVNIIWYRLPRWPRTKRLVENVSTFIPNLRYLQIDVLLTNKGPSLLNVIPQPEYIPLELISITLNNKGTRKFIKECFKEEEK